MKAKPIQKLRVIATILDTYAYQIETEEEANALLDIVQTFMNL